MILQALDARFRASGLRGLDGLLGGAGDLASKVTSRVIIGVAPFRVLTTLLITYLGSPVPLQVGLQDKVGCSSLCV